MQNRTHHNLGVSGGVNYVPTILICLFFLVLCSLPIGKNLAGESLNGVLPDFIVQMFIMFGMAISFTVLLPLTFAAKFFFGFSGILYFAIGAICVFFSYSKDNVLNKAMLLFSLFFFVQKIILDYELRVHENEAAGNLNGSCVGDAPLCATLAEELLMGRIFSLSVILGISILASLLITSIFKEK